jgi:dimethylargininase
MFSNAIVRSPCPDMVCGITTASLGQPNFEAAQRQHKRYIEALETCGVNVTVLDSDEDYPDSVFVEDTALITPECAIITNPGALSRRGETESMAEALLEFFSEVEEIKTPGTLDAGDIMMIGNHYYVGLSKRTNAAGANQLIEILAAYDLTGSTVELAGILHLKTGLSYLEDNILLIASGFLNEPQFKQFDQIPVADDEAYAANSVWINGTVLVPAGFPKTKAAIEAKGFKVIELNVSEFQKLDGGLSCLSLRF